MVKKLLKHFVGLIIETLYPLKYFFTTLIGYTGDLMYFLLPYIMLTIGEYVYMSRGKVTVGSEMFIPIVFFFLIGIIRTSANRMNKGKRVPTPHKRFTQIDDDGEVSIENDRVQELILYIADLEDWLERKGMM